METTVDETEQIYRWRAEQLRSLGFGVRQAEALAESHVDVRAEAEALIAAGCPVDVAFDILS